MESVTSLFPVSCFLFPVHRVLFAPVRMIMVPPRHYCVVLNPVARDDGNQVLFDESGQAKLRHADLEIRLTRDPFPLYPGEEIQQVREKPSLRAHCHIT